MTGKENGKTLICSHCKRDALITCHICKDSFCEEHLYMLASCMACANKDNWRPEEEKPPEDKDDPGTSEFVLVQAEGDVFTAYYDYTNDHWYSGDEWSDSNSIEYWQPLPKARKEK